MHQIKRLRTKLLLAAVALTTAAGAAEVLWRVLRRETQVRMYFRDASRRSIGLDPTSVADELAFRAGIQAAWPDPALPPGLLLTPAVGAAADWFGSGYEMPRHNLLNNVTWRPGARFFICYTGPRQPYFDVDGCVEYRFNQFGLRDRDDLELAKPAGTRRVVCLGDSFTLGWGVRQQANWPVLVESELRRRDPGIQAINCGGAGSAYADEYELALRHRHGRFQPDVVLVTLCLNDLLVTNGKLCHFRSDALPAADLPANEHRWWMHSQLLFDLSRRLAAADALDLDPSHDWVGELVDLPADHLWYRLKGETPACYWKGGAPQLALRRIRDWCSEHRARAAVAVWPLLQGLGPGRAYPFTRMHDLVREFCAAERIPFCDLLPALRDQAQETLWVSPADMHPNELAQQLAAPMLSAFVADALGMK